MSFIKRIKLPSLRTAPPPGAPPERPQSPALGGSCPRVLASPGNCCLGLTHPHLGTPGAAAPAGRAPSGQGARGNPDQWVHLAFPWQGNDGVTRGQAGRALQRGTGRPWSRAHHPFGGKGFPLTSALRTAPPVRMVSAAPRPGRCHFLVHRKEGPHVLTAALGT